VGSLKKPIFSWKEGRIRKEEAQGGKTPTFWKIFFPKGEGLKRREGQKGRPLLVRKGVVGFWNRKKKGPGLAFIGIGLLDFQTPIRVPKKQAGEKGGKLIFKTGRLLWRNNF